ncbi:hypothetical protein [Mesorhizobium sp. CN2-181]|uniref:hypothetical protein n=1 Tax=Mesorhizobium yinganensis TaxID=3157707 RepID=UPI0032B7E3F2
MPNTAVRAAAEGLPTAILPMKPRRRTSLDLLQEARAVYEALDALPGCVEGTPEAKAADRVYDAAMAMKSANAVDVLVRLLVVAKWGEYELAGRELINICAEAAKIVGVPAPGKVVQQ